MVRIAQNVYLILKLLNIRQLKGNVQTPMVRISLDNKSLRSQPRHGKAPRFNETIVFSVTKSEKDLLNLPIEIAVCTLYNVSVIIFLNV